jgi:CHAT domain-containing protein/tetratricopeptide (TPR) repeat protein
MLHHGRYHPPVLAVLAGFFVVVPLAVFAGESVGPADRPIAADSSAATHSASTTDSSAAAVSTSADSTAPTITAGASSSFVFPAATDSAAAILLQSGDAAAALELYERELLAASSLPPEHPALAMTHDRLGTVAWRMGDYERAKTELEAALLLYERGQGSEFPPIADVLGRLGSIALELGETRTAVALQRRALTIAEKERGSRSRTAAALERLGTALAAAADFKAAEAAHLRALELHESAADSLGIAASLHLLAGDARGLGAPERARAYLLRSRSILIVGYGPEHPGLDLSILGLAALAAADGDLDRARAHGREVVAIRRRALGPDHPLLADALATYAGSLLLTGHNSDAVDAALEAEAIRRDHLRFLARSLPDSEALRYGTRLASGLGAAVAASLRTWDSTMVERVWDAAARSRALVLDEMASRRHEAALRADSLTVALAAEAARTRQLLARVSARGPEGMEPGAYRGTLQRLRASGEETERRLLDRNPAAQAGAGSARANAGLAEARAGLRPGTGLVSLVRYLDPAAGSRRSRDGLAESGGRETWSYAAFVTAGPTAHARVIPLGDAGELDSLVSAWRRGVTTVGRGGGPDAGTGERRLGRILRQRLWDPIAPHLQGVERVVFVPDGAFHLVNPMALPLDEERFLVEEGPTFQILSSERDLVGPARIATPGAGFLAMADPDFDAPRRSVSWVDPVREWIRDAPEGSDPVYRGSRPCAGDASTHWPSLPGSAREVEEIARLWEQSGRGASQVFRGAAATEGSFKKHAPGKRALHLATHGFYAGPCEPGSSPLLQSGLVLAGANRGAADSAEGARTEDGVLTADEISAMDLTGVESAVLSGCETGVGVVLAGEGVLGLRRAFEIAGVQSLVLTLWPVTDDAARDWAVRFYEARLSKGLDAASAARDASRRMLEERRAAGAPVDPSTWGAFIAAGR